MSQFEYPRPQLVRDNWINLNGKWRFRFDDDLVNKMPEGVTGYVDWMSRQVDSLAGALAQP